MKIIILDKRITPPTNATTGSAGLDLQAATINQYMLAPGDTVTVPTGIKVFIEDPRLCGLLLPRSGLGTQGIILGNGTGVIDSDYQGELIVQLWNRGITSTVIKPLQKVAQLVIVPVVVPTWEIVKEFTPTQRGEGGFGSTGK